MFNAQYPYGYGPQIYPPFPPQAEDPLTAMKRWEKYKRKQDARFHRIKEEEKKKGEKKEEVKKKDGWNKFDVAIILILLSPFTGLVIGHAFLFALNSMVHMAHQVMQ